MRTWQREQLLIAGVRELAVTIERVGISTRKHIIGTSRSNEQASELRLSKKLVRLSVIPQTTSEGYGWRNDKGTAWQVVRAGSRSSLYFTGNDALNRQLSWTPSLLCRC